MPPLVSGLAFFRQPFLGQSGEGALSPTRGVPKFFNDRRANLSDSSSSHSSATKPGDGENRRITAGSATKPRALRAGQHPLALPRGDRRQDGRRQDSRPTSRQASTPTGQRQQARGRPAAGAQRWESDHRDHCLVDWPSQSVLVCEYSTSASQLLSLLPAADGCYPLPS